MFSANTSQVSQDAVFIEDTFSVTLYTGNGSTQTITNGIDLSGKGGLVWGKNRGANWSHYLADTAQGVGKFLSSNTTDATQLDSTSLTAFNSNGFSIGNAGAFINNNGNNYASWTFREQAKFFDVVTVTLGSSTDRQVAHNLASAPGVIIGKKTNNVGNWVVYHRSLGINKWLALQTTAAETSRTGTWGTTNPTATDFYFDETYFGSPGDTYIFYLFAHDAGGFGLTGTDNVISCGSFTTDGSGNADVTLGWEPQWLLVKPYSAAGYGWFLADNMRGMSVASPTMRLQPNTSGAEASMGVPAFIPTATGFQVRSFAESNIYIAIRRGPMKTPTSGTSVFYPNATTASVGTTITTGFPVDLQIQGYRPGISVNQSVIDRLRGVSSTTTESVPRLSTASTAAESSATVARNFDNTGFQISSGWDGNSMVYWNFRRAPSFFDEVCYTGTGANRTVNHNLGVAPELMIVKVRNDADWWQVYSSALGNTKTLRLNTADTSATDATAWNNTTPTSTVFTVGTADTVNRSAYTYVAWLWATCPGVSKVGSYTGTGTTLQIDCGFTGGARFVLIKRTDSTGDWYVWDSARGIVAGSDPYLTLNTTAAEVTTTDWVDTYSAGFELSNSAGNNVNINGATYIFLSVA